MLPALFYYNDKAVDLNFVWMTSQQNVTINNKQVNSTSALETQIKILEGGFAEDIILIAKNRNEFQKNLVVLSEEVEKKWI